LSMTEERHKINAYDQTAVKQLLDDMIMDTILREGYEEDNRISNIKLVVGVFACSLALMSHFYPLPFPDNVTVLKLCCVGYFICSAVLQYVVQYVEKDFILVTKPKQGGKTPKPALQVSTSFPKYDEDFTITIGHKGTSRSSSTTASIANWFDTEGGFVQDVFVGKVKDILASLEKSQ